MTMYRKTALVSAEQFLPADGKIPAGVFSDGLSDPRKSPAEWCLQTLEGQHALRNGDYICTGPSGERWNVEQSIFEATYEAVQEEAASTCGTKRSEVNPNLHEAERRIALEAGLRDLSSAASFVFNRLTNGRSSTRKELTDKLRSPIDAAQALLTSKTGE